VSGWRNLLDEFDRWPAGGASLWWRDDDATAPSARLDRLLALGGQPLALAVIPAQAEPALAERLADSDVDVLQHGFSHANHEPAGAKKAELGSIRAGDVVLEELVRGRARLRQLFGQRALPVLVPPWNRIAPELAARLPAHGYAGLSTVKPRPRQGVGPFRANVHIDIVDWRTGRRFIGAEAALGLLARHLAARRRGEADPGEPTGLLTHHIAMDEAAFGFVGEFLARSAAHGAVQWRAARDIFPPAGEESP
jgi:hypothetical protein